MDDREFLKYVTSELRKRDLPYLFTTLWDNETVHTSVYGKAQDVMTLFAAMWNELDLNLKLTFVQWAFCRQMVQDDAESNKNKECQGGTQ